MLEEIRERKRERERERERERNNAAAWDDNEGEKRVKKSERAQGRNHGCLVVVTLEIIHQKKWESHHKTFCIKKRATQLICGTNKIK